MFGSYHYAKEMVSAMREAGIIPAEDIAQSLSENVGQVVRFHCVGDRRGRKNGYAILFTDSRPAGAFGNLATQSKLKWSASHWSGNLPDFRNVSENRERKDFLRQADLRSVAYTAAALLDKAEHLSADHPYLAKKGIIGPPNIYQLGDQVLVPLTDIYGKLWNLQRIAPDGTKRFLRGPRKERTFWSVGLNLDDDATPDPDRIIICEGIATACAVFMTTVSPVVAALDCHSLVACAKALRGRFPTSSIVICADDDQATAERIGRNPGMEAAEAAAAAVGAYIAVPRMIRS